MKRLRPGTFQKQSNQWLMSGLILGGTIVAYAPAALADITPSLIFNPTNVTQGGTAELTLTLGNNSLTPVANLQFNNTLPAGARIARTAPIVSNTCNGILTAAPLATTFSLTGGDIPALAGGVDGECKIVLKILGIAGGNQIVNFAANSITGGAVSNSQGAQATLQVAGLAKMGTIVTFGPTLIPQTGSSTMTVKFDNPNAIALTGANFASLLPAGLKIKGASFLTNTCGGALTIDPPPTGFKLTGGIIPAGGCEFSWEIEGDLPGGTSQQQFTYSFLDDLVTTDQFVSNSAGSSNLTIQQGLRIQQSLSRGSANPRTVGEGQTLQIYTGETAKLTMTLSNAGGALNNLTLNQTLLGGLEIADNITSSTCAGMTVTATAGATAFSFAGGTMPAATATTLSTCEVTVNVKAATVGNYTNTIGIGNISNTETSNNLNQSVINIDVVNISTVGGNSIDVGINFAGGMNAAFYAGNAISAGNSARMAIAITNDTGVPLQGVGFGAGVALPAGVNLAANPNVTTDCPGGATASVTAAPDTVLLSGATLDRRETCRVFVSVVSAAANTYTATANAGSFVAQNALNTAQNFSNNAGSGNLVVLDYINFEQSFIPTTVAASATGNPARMKLRLTNAALAASAGTKLRFNLAGNLKLKGGFLTNTCGGTLTLPVDGTIFDLAGGLIPAATGQGLADDGFCEIEYDVIATQPTAGTITNTIPPNALTNDAGQSNKTPIAANLNIAAVNVVVNQQVINVTPGDPNNGQPIVTGGEPAQLRVTLTNNSGITLTNLNYLNNLPQDVIVYTVPDPQAGTCTGATIAATPEANNYAVNGISLSPNASCTLTLKVTSLTSLNRDINIAVKDIKSTEGGSNDQASIVTLTTRANATVSKAFDPPTIAAGTASTLTLKVVNANVIPLTSVELADVFPAGIVVADTPAVTNGCGGTLSAASGDARVLLTGGTMPASSICTIKVNVTALTAQPYTNTIPAQSLKTAEGRTNLRDIQAILDVTGTNIIRPGLKLVKRVTQISNPNGTATPDVIDLSNRIENFRPTTGRDDDNAANWPTPIDTASGISSFLKGVHNATQIVQQGRLQMGSTIEYAGYFLSDGTGIANNAQLCDFLPAQTEFVPGSIVATLGNGTALTGTFLPAGSAFPTACKGTNNGNGAVVIDLGNLANTTAAGTPNTSYGSFKFKAKVK